MGVGWGMERREELMCSFPFMPSTGPTLVGHMAVHGLEACRLAKRLTLESLGDSVWNFGLINNML